MAVFASKHSFSRKHLLPSLIAVAICYTMMYNYFLFAVVPVDEDDDAECLAMPGDATNVPPHCSEVLLFRDWSKSESQQVRPQETRTSDEPDESLLLAATPTAGDSTQSAAAKPQSSLRASVASTTTMELKKQSSQVDDMAESQQQRAKHRNEEFDRLEKEVQESLDHPAENTWIKDLENKEHQFEVEMEKHESHHTEMSDADKKELTEWQEQIDRLEATIHYALHAGSDAPWTDELASLKHRLSVQMDPHMRRYHSHDQKVFELKHAQLDKLEEAIRAPPRSKLQPLWDQLGSSDFEISQMRVKLELKMSSHSLANRNSQHQVSTSTAGQTKHPKRELVARVTDLESSLSDLVSDGKAWEKKLLGTTVDTVVTAAPSSPSSSGFLQKRLHWSSVKELSHSVILDSAKDTHATISKSEVRSLHWSGAIPRVACITPLAYSRHAKARMMYFIDNFKLQDYEGAKQLVIVYHHLDTDATELVQKYADGFFVKGVAARGDEAFPSNAALRYGAWSADADVIMRWEFDEWHDPSRISMQVRAMAATSRPGCLLSKKQSLEDTSTGQADAVVQQTTLAGEKSWMKVYWQPFHEVAGNLVAPPVAHVVELTLKNLQASSELKPFGTSKDAAADSLKKASEETTTQAPSSKVQPAHEWTLSECLDLDKDSSIPGLTSHTEEVIDQNLGHGMSKMFHRLMARRHDITTKVQLLCMETTMSSDIETHSYKKKHVEQMLGIRSELDKHITGLVGLFPAQEER